MTASIAEIHTRPTVCCGCLVDISVGVEELTDVMGWDGMGWSMGECTSLASVARRKAKGIGLTGLVDEELVVQVVVFTDGLVTFRTG